MIRLIIADDHQVVRDGLKAILAQHRDINVVGEAGDGDAVLQMVKQKHVDVVLLDVTMPGPGVLDLVPAIKKMSSRTRILILTMHSEQTYGRRVLQAGADGFLDKTQSSAALATAIRHVDSGHKYLTQSLAEELASELAAHGDRQPHEMLSNREYQVFLQLGSGRSVDATAKRMKLSPKTVRTYRSRIFEKAGFTSTSELMFYAINRGLVTSGAETGATGAAHAPRRTPSRPRSK
jgi:two-component system, NarL family, invasion response regulator UvrY